MLHSTGESGETVSFLCNTLVVAVSSLCQKQSLVECLLDLLFFFYTAVLTLQVTAAQTHRCKYKPSSFRWTASVHHAMHRYSRHQRIQTYSEWMKESACVSVTAGEQDNAKRQPHWQKQLFVIYIWDYLHRFLDIHLWNFSSQPSLTPWRWINCVLCSR